MSIEMMEVRPPTECKICGEEFKVVNHMHLKKHDITYQKYNKQYNKDYYYFKQISKKLYGMYIRRIDKWIEQTADGVYITIHNDEDHNFSRSWPLNLNDIEKHVKGEKTIGCYFPNYSHMMAIDIDIPIIDGGIEAVQDITAVIDSLTDKNYLVSYSGNKGYHVDLFFDQTYDKKNIRRLYDYIIERVDYSRDEIELRGGENQSGYKLPLGIHKQTGNRCNITNKNGEIDYTFNKSNLKSIHNSLSEVDNINLGDILNKIDNKPLSDTEVEDGESLSREMSPIKSVYEKAYSNKSIKSNIKMIESREIKEDTRHKTAFAYAVLLKATGLDSKEIYNRLKRLHDNLDTSSYSTPDYRAYKEYERISKDVMKDRYKPVGRTFVNEHPSITHDDMKIILRHPKKSRRKVMFALLVHAKVFAKDDGSFYMSYDMINDFTNTNNKRATIKSYIEDLENIGCVELVGKKQVKDSEGYKKINVYRVPDLVIARSELDTQKEFKKCNLKDKNCNDCYYKMCKSMLDKDEIEEYFSGKEKTLVKFASKCKNIA